MQDRTTVVGVFNDRDQAERAVEELRRLGFTDDQIGFAARGEDQPRGTRAVGESDESDAGEGAATGAVSGGVIGGLIGAAVSGLIPGIGPIIAGGILASVLGGAAVGAAAGGLMGALVGEGVPEEEARFYEEEFRGGRTIVTVRSADRFDEVQNTLRRFGAYDVHSQERGTAGTTSTADTTGTSMSSTRSTTGGTRGTGDRSTFDTGMTGTSDWNTISPRYQSTWQQQYGTSGRRWEDAEPYYRYSYEMSSNPRYQGRSWSEVENDLRSGYGDWAGRSGYQKDDSAWDDVKDSLRDAWDSLVGRGRETRSTTTGRTDRTDRDTGDRMQLREEQLDVTKQDRETGEVRLRKEVVEENKTIDVPVRREEVYVERHPVSGDRPATGDIGEGEIRVPIREEVVDVEKRAVVREEIEVGKRDVQGTERVSDTIRREEARLETEGSAKIRDESSGGTSSTSRGQSQSTRSQSSRTHEHRFDEKGRCLDCGKTRDELAA